MTDAVALVCAPFLEAREVVAGSVVGNCRFCGCQVWIAPTGQRRLDSGEASFTVCVPCVESYDGAPFAPSVEDITPEQIAELRRHLRRRRGGQWN